MDGRVLGDWLERVTLVADTCVELSDATGANHSAMVVVALAVPLTSRAPSAATPVTAKVVAPGAIDTV
jgi:hypothetical protein